MPGIVLDSGAKPGLLEHLDIEVGPLRDPLRLQKLVLTLKFPDPLFQFFFYILHGALNIVLIYYIVGCWEDGYVLQFIPDLPGQDVDLRDPVDLVPEKFYPDGGVRLIGRNHLQYVPPDPEGPAVEIHVIAVVLDLDQLRHQLVPLLCHAGAQGDHHVLVVYRAS